MAHKIEYKCPHCGWTFPASKTTDGLVPTHTDDARSPSPRTPAACPGSKETPRSVHDQRPLWKDENQ